MKPLTTLTFAFATSLVALSFPNATFPQSQIAGIIEEIRGRTYLRKDHRSKETRLDRKRDRARILHVGEQVRPGPNGYLRLFLCSGRKEIWKTSNWFSISSAESCPNQAALDEYGDVGSRRRGDQTLIFSPSDHSVVWPDRFILLWTPSTAKCVFSFAIKEPDGRDIIWAQENIDGSQGRLNSENMRYLLKQYREMGGKGPLRFRMVDSCGNDLFLTFSLLSLKSETLLKEELARWDKQRGGFMFHLGRAYVFERYGIFPAVAEEFEAALKLAPDSRDLLIRTIVAHHDVGNYAREKELRKRLPEDTVP